eukprot:m.83217 g.83217  ORF g.83217 m.83217 type:complete len:411 (+) comp14647_c0_seq7:207-1439(+)
MPTVTRCLAAAAQLAPSRAIKPRKPKFSAEAMQAAHRKRQKQRAQTEAVALKAKARPDKEKPQVKRITKPHGTIVRQGKLIAERTVEFDTPQDCMTSCKIKQTSKIAHPPFKASKTIPFHMVTPELTDQIASFIRPKGQHIIEQALGPGFATQSFLQYGAGKVTSLTSRSDNFRLHWSSFAALQEAYPRQLTTINARMDRLASRLPNQDPWYKPIFEHESTRTWNDPPPPISITMLAPCSKGLTPLHYLIYSMGMKSGIFEYGRLPVYALLPKPLACRFFPRGNIDRISLLTQHVADVQELAAFPRQLFKPSVVPELNDKLSLHLLKLTPKPGDWTEEDFRAFDYITQKLTMFRNQISARISCLGPGANELIEIAGINPNTSCNRLSFADYKALARAYQQWPKRPKHSLE